MNKKMFCRILMLTLCLMLALSPMAWAATYGIIKMPTRDGSVNLRKGPGTSYAVVGWGLHGDEVEILKEGAKWDRVRLIKNGRTGYLFNRYLIKTVDGTSLSGWGQMAHVKTKYASSTVNLRSGPSTAYASIALLRPDDKLAVLGKSGNWYEVQLMPGKKVGYIYKDYITNGVPGITTGDVNMRKKGSNSAKIIRVLPKDTEITVLNIGKKWTKIQYGKQTGYIFNKYFSVY